MPLSELHHRASFMDTETVRTVLNLGFTEDMVKRVIEKRLRTAGIVFRTTCGIGVLVVAIVNM